MADNFEIISGFESLLSSKSGDTLMQVDFFGSKASCKVGDYYDYLFKPTFQKEFMHSIE